MENKIEYEFVKALQRRIVVNKDGYWSFANYMNCCDENHRFSPFTKDPNWEFICPHCGNKHEVKLISDGKARVCTFRPIKYENVDFYPDAPPPDNEGYFTAIRDGKFRFHWPRVFALLLLVCLAVLFLVFLFQFVKNA